MRSLHADNAEPPYAEDGTLNGEHWAETVNFDTVSEEYFGALRAEVDRAEDAGGPVRRHLRSSSPRFWIERCFSSMHCRSLRRRMHCTCCWGRAIPCSNCGCNDGEWVSFGGADIVLNTTTFYSGTLAAGGWAGGKQTLALAEVAAEDAVYAVPADGYARPISQRASARRK